MIDIKDIQGNVILSVSIAPSSQKVEELMGSDYIQLSWNSNTGDMLPLGSYIEHEGERYSLLEPYTPSQKNEVEYTYNPQFKSRVMTWGKMPFFFYSEESKEPDWTLTSNPADFMRCICDAIYNETGETWSYSIDASLPASASLSFTSVDILSGLNQIAGAFETEWFADKSTNTLYLGLFSHGEAVTLKVGENINVPSVQGNKEGYYTRFYAFGSTRNITQDYEGSNTNNLVNKRLTLDPIKYPNGYKDIRSGLSKGEIFSKVLIFDEVYPSANLKISGVRNRLMYSVDETGEKIQVGTDEEGKPIYDQYAIWFFRIEGFEFDYNNVIDGYKPHISFQSGALQGREFEVKYYEKDETLSNSGGLTFEVNAGDYEIFFIEEGTYIIPSMTGLVPSDGDSVILFNIKMPSEYTQSAYVKLEEELDKEIARMTSDLNNYSFKSNPVAFNESNPNLSIGRAVNFVNGDYSYNTRVIKLITQLDFPIEQEITIGNQKVKGNTQQLKEEVASANKDLNLLAVFNEMTQSIQQSYARTQQMMLEGFAAIKNIWQLRETESGEKYAWSAFNVVTQMGLTSFTDGTSLDLPGIYDGLPIDNQTLYWDESDGVKTLVAKGSGEGTIKDVDISGTGNAITEVMLSSDGSVLEFTKGLEFALKTDFDTTKKKLDDFLEGSDTDTIINKWKELETFLSGLAETDNLATILNTKADKTYVDDNFITKDDAESQFVTIGTAQTITGAKDFTGGLKVNGNPIVYNKDKGYWMLEGDLLITGGITSFASDTAFVPSTITDAVLIDNVTIGRNSSGHLYVKSTGDEGGTVKYPLTWTGFDNGSWDGSEAKTIHIPSKLSELTDDLVSGKYLPLTGGTLTGQLKSTLATGTAPISVASTTLCTNLNSDMLDGKHLSDILASNVSSATKLQTARKIWGQSFDGTGDVDGLMTVNGNATFSGNVGIGTTSPAYKLDVKGIIHSSSYILLDNGNYYQIKNSGGNPVALLGLNSNNNMLIGQGVASSGYNTYLYGKTMYLYTGGTTNVSMAILSNGNTLIGTTTDSGYKLDVNGTMRVNGNATFVGNIIPSATSYNIGSSANRWGTLYAQYANLSANLSVAGTSTFSGVTNHNAGLNSTFLNVNGGKITYDSTNGYFKLDGDLLVTGGITSFADSTSFSPSTIMDGVVVDGVTIQKNSYGQLEVIGGTGGGTASSVAWENIEGKPSFATVATSGSYNDLSNKPTSLKSPYALAINNSSGVAQVSYDGSAAKSLTLSKAMVGLGSVENTALSTWTGSSYINKLGTITSGVWNGSAIGASYLPTATTSAKGIASFNSDDFTVSSGKVSLNARVEVVNNLPSSSERKLNTLYVIV